MTALINQKDETKEFSTADRSLNAKQTWGKTHKAFLKKDGTFSCSWEENVREEKVRELYRRINIQLRG